MGRERVVLKATPYHPSTQCQARPPRANKDIFCLVGKGRAGPSAFGVLGAALGVHGAQGCTRPSKGALLQVTGTKTQSPGLHGLHGAGQKEGFLRVESA